MKYQYVNLYHDDLKQKREYLSAKEILIVVALVSAVMLLYSVYSIYSVKNHDRQSVELQSDVSVLSATVSELAAMTKPQEDPQLVLEARRLESEIRHLRRLRELASVPLESAPPEKFLRAVARQKPDGMWFNVMYLASAGEDIVLEGYVINPELLPKFIETLGMEEALRGKNFHTLEILPVETEFNLHVNSSQLRFFRMVAGCKTSCDLTSGEAL